MKNVAFIGLGIMGMPMARNLVAAGYTVTGYNRTPKPDALSAAGVRVAKSIPDAVKETDVIAVMVGDSPDVTSVLRDKDAGVFEHARPGALILDFSSIRPDVSATLAKEAKERGFRMLDAPVSGGETGAIQGTLSIMVGGSPEDYAAAKPVLEAVGKTIVHVGPSGAGQTVKAANQLIVASNIQALSEAIVFLRAFGVDLKPAIEVLGGGLAGSAVLDQKAAKMLEADFTPGFKIDLHHKDMGIVTSSAREAGVPIPIGSAVAQLVAATKARGRGHLDHSALFLTTEDLSGAGIENNDQGPQG